MKKSLGILGLSLVILLTFGLSVQAQPKEVTEPATTTYYVTAKVVPFGENSFFMTYEGFGLTVSNTGEGLFHGGTVRLLGSLTSAKGVFNDERGYGVWNLQNGDKVFFKYTVAGKFKPKGGTIANGTVTFIGGTGKCTGIQGSFEFTRDGTQPTAEGIVQSYVKAKIKYMLP